MSIATILTRAASRFPSSTAWIDGDKTISFTEAERRSNALARKLNSIGGQPGDRVGLLMHNCSEALESMFAVWKAGMGVVPANVRLGPNELGHIFGDSSVKFIIYAARFSDTVKVLKKTCGVVEKFICLGQPGDADLDYGEVVEGDATSLDITALPSDLAWIFYTSGTTGKPKGAMLSHRNILTMVSQIQIEMNTAVKGDVLFHAAPVTHGSGLMAFNNMAMGAANAFDPTMDSFDPDHLFALIEKHRITTIFLVPTMVRMLSTSPSVSKYDLSSLCTVIYGGAPMPYTHLEEAIERFGLIFVQLYGQAEAPMSCSVLPKSEHCLAPNAKQLRHMKSAGREMIGTQIAILDDNDREVPCGDTGEICVRSDLVMGGYWNNPEATAQALRSGWLHTGDVGYFDEDRYLYISDRTKDMIISGGANIYPREVEDALCSHQAVLEAAVFGVPDDKWGESVRAVLVLKESHSASEEGIKQHCKSLIAGYKCPRNIEFVDMLPKSAYGKILRRELRDSFWDGAGRLV